MRILLIFIMIPLLLSAQEYYEARGRTEVFSLKAGATASPLTARESPVIIHKNTIFRIFSAGNFIYVNNNKAGKLTIYMLDGRIRDIFMVNTSGMAVLKHPLENGIYLVRFETEDAHMKTCKLVITGR